ncbi:MAG TPA: glycosyltransferase family 87 protein [Candidatus Saccharimonadales bacterium]|nr:glycosyltransferase family 87 protein [Candidatus Saccharimonadales bacterium]
MKNIWFKILAVIFFLASFILITRRNLPWIYSSIGPDFTEVWISAKDLIATKGPYLDPNLYWPNAYPPITEIFFLPLALLSHQKALVIFTYISFASIIGSVFLTLKIAMKKVPWYYFLLFLGFSFMSFPVKFSLGMGQVNIIVLFLLLFAVFLEIKSPKNSLLAGLSLGVAIAIKPIFTFFLLFFTLKKSWKLVFISILTVTVLVLATLIFWPPQIWISWYQSAILPLNSFTAPYMYVYSNQGVFGFAAWFVSNFSARIYIHTTAMVILIPLAVYLVLKNKDFDLGLSFFIITLLLFDTTSWQHHFVWLMFPFVVLFINIFKSKKVVLLGLLIFSYLLVSWVFKDPNHFPVILRPTQFYGNVILWGMNFYFLSIRQIKSTKLDNNSIGNKIFKFLNFS